MKAEFPPVKARIRANFLLLLLVGLLSAVTMLVLLPAAPASASDFYQVTVSGVPQLM
jgi:hypothetical protein